MKNTLFLDATFSPELLENEETNKDESRNSIYLRFTTTAAANQKLQITVRSSVYEIPVASSTSYNYELLGQFWTAGGVTSVRITNDGFTSDYVYFTFPEIISSDAALQETEDNSREFYLQGKNEDVLEIKSATASYRNGIEYNITSLTRFVQFVFASRAETATGLLTMTATITCSGISAETFMRFHIRVNLIFDEIFIPTQTVKNGTYIVTLTYPVENIAQSDRNSIDIYLEMDEGNAQILQGAAIATLTGAGVVPSDKFIGLIELLDITTPFALTGDTPLMAEATEAIQTNLQIPVGANLSDTTAVLPISEPPISSSINEAMTIVGYGSAEERTLEDGETIRVTENGVDVRYTEQES